MVKSNPTIIARWIIYGIAFLFALHQATFAYVNSSFLAQFVGEGNVGLVYTFGSIITIAGFLFIRPILRKFGNYKTFLAVLFIDLISLVLLGFLDNPAALVGIYIVGYTMRNLAMFHLDIFLEDVSDDKDTGGIRGLYLSIMSLSYIIGPLMAGVILSDSDYWKVYLLGAVILLPTFFMLIRYLNHFKDPEYKEPQFRKTAQRVFGHKDMYSVFAINSLLRFFYAWMVIYAPIYMNQYIGFTISQTTFIVGTALIAFVILEAPLGWLADKYRDEKHPLIFGFIILAFSTAVLSFLNEPNFWLWAAVLFMTRVGASFVEVMSEAYFFKKIDSSDINVLGFFRILRPFVYAVAPLLASLLLLVIDIKFLFLILGVILLYGIKYSLDLEDNV